MLLVSSQVDLWQRDDTIAVVDLPDGYDSSIAVASNCMLGFGILGVLVGFCTCRSTSYLAMGSTDGILSCRGTQLHSFIFVTLSVSSFLLFLGLILYASLWPSSTFPYGITYSSDFSPYLVLASAFMVLADAIWVWRFYQLQLPPRLVASLNACCVKMQCCFRCLPKNYQCPQIRNIRPKVLRSLSSCASVSFISHHFSPTFDSL
jgi:predicted neutral ceramidase superfamily lipid hydrolase